MAHDAFAPPLHVRAPAGVAHARNLLARDGLTVACVAGWIALLAAVMPGLFVSDSWLALVDGRLVARHGLPHADTLTAWTVGRHWVDQQWGAHLLLYGAFRAGGLTAVACLGIALTGAALAGVAVAARRLGGSPRSTVAAALLPLVGAPWLAQVRTQSFALPLFVAVFALLAADARKPGRRVLLVLPLLVVWANLHGSVALAAGLAFLCGARAALGRRWTGAALLAAPAALVASPYAFALIGYYRLMLLHPPLASVVQEWQPVSLRGATAPFLVSAFCAAALWGRHRSALTSFERWALPLLLVAALAAVRNAVWFELALAVALPRLLDAVRASADPLPGVRRANVVLASAAVLGAAWVVVAHLERAPSFDRFGTSAQAAAISAAAGPHGLVLADDRHADWLLWQRPELAGRVAYDVRFELFSAPELRQIVSLDHAERTAWARCGAAASVVTFHSSAMSRLARSQRVLGRAARLVVDTPQLQAFAQAPVGTACRL